LCPQSICGSAIFVGVFGGRIGANPHTFGTVAVSVTHDPLPAPYQVAAVTGGLWQLSTLAATYGGTIASGTLFNNGNNTYTVTVTMVLLRGGSGSMSFVGILDHRVFPPTIKGLISQ
jgi:hypothetical protein